MRVRQPRRPSKPPLTHANTTAAPAKPPAVSRRRCAPNPALPSGRGPPRRLRPIACCCSTLSMKSSQPLPLRRRCLHVRIRVRKMLRQPSPRDQPLGHLLRPLQRRLVRPFRRRQASRPRRLHRPACRVLHSPAQQPIDPRIPHIHRAERIRPPVQQRQPGPIHRRRDLDLRLQIRQPIVRIPRPQHRPPDSSQRLQQARRPQLLGHGRDDPPVRRHKRPLVRRDRRFRPPSAPAAAPARHRPRAPRPRPSSCCPNRPARPPICRTSEGVSDRSSRPSHFISVENTTRRIGRFSPIPMASVATSTGASPSRNRRLSARRTSGPSAP